MLILTVANGRPFGSAKQETSYNSERELFNEIAKLKPSEFSEDLCGMTVVDQVRLCITRLWYLSVSASIRHLCDRMNYRHTDRLQKLSHRSLIIIINARRTCARGLLLQ